MNRFLACAAIFALASAASARPDPRVSIEFTDDPVSGWFAHWNMNPGESVLARIVVSIPDSYYGLASARYNIVANNSNGWDFGGDDSIDLSAAKGSATDGRVAGFDFGMQTQEIFESINSLRIDAKGDSEDRPSTGISTAQNTPGAMGSAFNTGKVVEVYRFTVHTSPGHTYSDLLALRIADGGAHGSPNQITTFKVYESASSTAGLALTGVVGSTGVISFLPAPSSAMFLSLAGLAATRRKR